MRVQYGQLRDAVKIKEGKNNFRAWTTLDGGEGGDLTDEGWSGEQKKRVREWA